MNIRAAPLASKRSVDLGKESAPSVRSRCRSRLRPEESVTSVTRNFVLGCAGNGGQGATAFVERSATSWRSAPLFVACSAQEVLDCVVSFVALDAESSGVGRLERPFRRPRPASSPPRRAGHRRAAATTEAQPRAKSPCPVRRGSDNQRCVEAGAVCTACPSGQHQGSDVHLLSQAAVLS